MADSSEVMAGVGWARIDGSDELSTVASSAVGVAHVLC